MTYENQYATAVRLIAKFGGPMSIVSAANITVESTTPWVGTTTTVTEEVTGVRIPMGTKVFRPGKDTPTGTDVFYFDGAADVPIGSTITVGTDNYRILKLDVLSPNGSERILTTAIAQKR